MNEDAGGVPGVFSREHQPLVKYHEDQVAKEAEQEQDLRQEHQVQIVFFPKVSVLMWKTTFSKIQKTKHNNDSSQTHK